MENSTASKKLKLVNCMQRNSGPSEAENSDTEEDAGHLEAQFAMISDLPEPSHY